ncbi:uncharacterized protein LOC128200745 [Galleria mellonella]|uniref:Uncharacterized protein LOC128200745 n=1 Tax=Galleria mellonella TaxID=7137 RepID=A0ABM3MI41_GALME|nr:uncharacterized protein LOC128200745 [Galleria mellonella]
MTHSVSVLRDFSLISELFKVVIKPYINSIQVSQGVVFRFVQEASVERTIKNKIDELRALLQDSDVNEDILDKLTLEGTDKTTIIEFLPKPKEKYKGNILNAKSESLKSNIQKYKIVRDQIKAELAKEYVSDNTQKSDIQIHDLLSQILQDTENLSSCYKVKCKLVNRDVQNEKENSIINLDTKDLSDKQIKARRRRHKCQNFKICTNELKKFMTDFYNSLNDTAVSKLRNYASMYVSDVNTDGSNEKEAVVSLINKIVYISERKVSKIFRKETLIFNLYENKNIENNIKYLRDYIKNTIIRCNDSIVNKLDVHLKSLRARLLLTVKQDIRANLDVDLGNFERDLKGCVDFSTCNGKYNSRRNVESNRRYHGINTNIVYFKVQFNLDDELKDEIVKTVGSVSRFGGENFIEKRHKRFRKHQDDNPKMIKGKYNNLNITRTTYEILTRTLATTESTKNSNVFMNNNNINIANMTKSTI